MFCIICCLFFFFFPFGLVSIHVHIRRNCGGKKGELVVVKGSGYRKKARALRGCYAHDITQIKSSLQIQANLLHVQ